VNKDKPIIPDFDNCQICSAHDSLGWVCLGCYLKAKKKQEEIIRKEVLENDKR